MNNIAPAKPTLPPPQRWRVLNDSVKITLRIDVEVSQGVKQEGRKLLIDDRIRVNIEASFVISDIRSIFASFYIDPSLALEEARTGLETFSEIVCRGFPNLSAQLEAGELLNLITVMVKQAPGTVPQWAQSGGVM